MLGGKIGRRIYNLVWELGTIDINIHGSVGTWDIEMCVPYILLLARRCNTGLIPVLGSQPAGDVSHKPDGRLPLFSARPAVTPATLKRPAINVAAW